MLEVVLDALLDSLYALPILFLVYLLIEFLEHKDAIKFEKFVSSSKKLGPLWGTGLGIIPQCGFSAVMSDLYSKRMITIGTLFAVFIATSDEALVVLISQPGSILSLLLLVGIKAVLAIIIGFTIDLIFRKQSLASDNFTHTEHIVHSHNNKENTTKHENCNHDETCDKHADCANCEHNALHHKHIIDGEENKASKSVIGEIFFEAFKHAAIIFAWLAVANILISVTINVAGGEEFLSNLVGSGKWYEPLVCAAIGLIPNCASSVVLTEMYLKGVISFASCLGGLVSGAGVGMIVLFKNNKNVKKNILIILSLLTIGIAVGYLFGLFLPYHI